VIEAKSTVVKVVVRLVRSLVEGIADLDKKIEEAAAAHPDFFIFESLPGAGAVMAPRLPRSEDWMFWSTTPARFWGERPRSAGSVASPISHPWQCSWHQTNRPGSPER